MAPKSNTIVTIESLYHLPFENMEQVDLCFAWNWKYDVDFADILAAACREQGINLLQVTPTNLEDTLKNLVDKRLIFRTFFDRASDADDRFNPLALWARQLAVFHINRYRQARRSWDKAAMHQCFVSAGLDTPHTIILPSLLTDPGPEPVDLTALGGCFAIKPAHGGGGIGVITGACSWEQVQAARQQNPFDQYMVQAHIEPTWMDGRRSWFRILYCAGEVFPCWWDTHTHIYAPVTDEQCERLGLHHLYEITRVIARLVQLELFSTEVAYTANDRFVIVDYVNDPIDLRLQSRTGEGVPDWIVWKIARRLVELALNSPKIFV